MQLQVKVIMDRIITIITTNTIITIAQMKMILKNKIIFLIVKKK